MKILLLGKDGQLGWELQRSLAPLGELIALGPDTPGGDYTRLDEVKGAVRSIAPDVIVNADAHTAADKAEGEPGLARQLNTHELQAAFGLTLPPWQTGVARMLAEILKK